jgi:hypothetical protein
MADKDRTPAEVAVIRKYRLGRRVRIGAALWGSS